MSWKAVTTGAMFLIAMALAVQAPAAARRDSREKAIASRRAVSRVEVQRQPQGPCGWFNPEGCPDREPAEEPRGCTSRRTDKIDRTAASYPYSLFIGAPTGGYVEVGEGCKRDFEEGTVYVGTPVRYSKVVCGPVRDLYVLLGEDESELGWPLGSKAQLPHDDAPYGIPWLPNADLSAVGWDFAALPHRYRFTNGWVYWHPDDSAPRVVLNLVHDFFTAQGGTPELGFPRNDESPDSHSGAVLFQAFGRGLIFENVHGDLEVIRDGLLDSYLEAAAESRGVASIDDPLDAETELGLVTSDYLPTPSGSIRTLHRGTVYYRGGDALEVYPDSVLMLDGRVVVPGANPDTAAMRIAVEEDPYLADFRKDVVLEALSHEGLCGDAARRSVGTISTEYCSEFVREVYIAAGVDRFLWGGGIYLWSVTYAAQLRWIFQHNSRFVRARHADLLTAEPGDYLSIDDEGHSALVVATSADGAHLFRVGGNEGPDDCVDYWRDEYFDASGSINPDFYGFGKLDASFFD